MKPHKLPEELIKDLEPELDLLEKSYNRAVEDEEKTIEAHVAEF